MAAIRLPEIIGLPPLDNSLDDKGVKMSNLITDSMPIIEITPAEPNFIIDVQGYELTPDVKKYTKELENLGFTMNKQTLKVAYMANNPPSETFNNDFGDSLMESAGKIISAPLQQAKFMGNIQSVEGLAKKLKDMGGEFGNVKMNETIQKIGESAKQGEQVVKDSGGAKILNTLKSAALGNSFLFPDVWKSSTYSTSYSINVRLYNPNPNDNDTTQRTITGPLAALLMFVVPRSKDGDSFFWPWLCKIHSAGLFQVQTAYVKSISVIKGGDDNVIAWNQNMGIVDVKIDFGNVFESMLNFTKKGSPGAGAVPLLKDYIGEFQNIKPLQNPTYYEKSSAGSGNQKTYIPISRPGAGGTGGTVIASDRQNPTSKVATTKKTTNNNLVAAIRNFLFLK